MNKKELLESLRKQGFSESILKAFKNVRREDFIPEQYKGYAYEDIALPTVESQTISQPYTITFMLSLLELDKIKNKKAKILEIGSGSGYVLALLAEICKKAELYGLEIKRQLVENSSALLSNNKNINIFNKSGFHGLPEKAPFDRILVSASAQKLEDLNDLVVQLKDSGILVSPVRNSIFKIKKRNGKIETQEHNGFVFVPLVR